MSTQSSSTAPAASETKTLEAKCFCGSIHFTVDVPAASLPLSTYLCHCTLCRYATGAPCIFHAAFPLGALPKFIAPSSEKNLTIYKGGKECTYDSCSTCGCHIAGVPFDRQQDWSISTSIFAEQSPDIFCFRSHAFSNSAPGGILPSVLSRIGDRDIKSYNPPDDAPSAKFETPKTESGANGEDRVRAQCHCGGISFTIGRPTKEMLDDPLISKYVSHRDNKKWIATYDICDDCRLIDGTHVVGWTFVPLTVIEPTIETDLKIGTAKTFKSSDGVLRSFCGTCGATVFFSSDKRLLPEGTAVVDIATGILRFPEGVMGEKWLTWRSRVAYEGSGIAFNKGFGEAMRDGLKKWSDETYGEQFIKEI